MTRALPWLLLVGLAVGAGVYLRSASDGVLEAWDDEVEQLVRGNAELGRRLEQELRRSPGSHVVGSATATTGSVTAHGTPRPSPVCPPAPPSGPSPENGLDSATTTAPGNQPAILQPSCLLAIGDAVELRVGQVALDHRRTADLTLVGAASAWRMSPAPETELASGTFSARLDLPEPVGRWGLGLGLVGSLAGVSPALAVAAPPARILGWSVEAVGAVGWGAGGPVASAAVVVRP